jgi:hypothetical protein
MPSRCRPPLAIDGGLACRVHLVSTNVTKLYWLTSKSRKSGRSRTYRLVFVDVCPWKLKSGLCQNCVTYPPKPCGNTVIYGDTLKQIVVVGSR